MTRTHQYHRWSILTPQRWKSQRRFRGDFVRPGSGAWPVGGQQVDPIPRDTGAREPFTRRKMSRAPLLIRL